MAEKTKITVEGAETRAKKSKFVRAKAWLRSHKRLSIALFIILLLLVTGAVVYAIPTARYAVLSPVVAKDYKVKVVDSMGGRALAGATVEFAGESKRTNAKGFVSFAHVPVGYHDLTVRLALYDTVSREREVPVFGTERAEVSLRANGKRVTVNVVDRLSGEPIVGANVTAGKSTALTQQGGRAHVVIPAGSDESLEAQVTAQGYLPNAVAVGDKPADVSLVKEGRMYFLSKQSGTIDVVSTNFDGSDRKVLLQGTGNEEDYGTSLFASRDWRYLALKSKRDTKNASLYLVDTQRPELTRVTNGDTNEIELVGWSDHRFIYKEYALGQYGADYDNWQIQSVAAVNRAVTTLDKKSDAMSQYSRPVHDNADLVYILDGGTIVYAKVWSSTDEFGMHTADQQSGVMAVQSDGSAKRWLKFYSSNEVGQIETKLYKPQEIHYRVTNRGGVHRENLMTVNKKIEIVPPALQKFDISYPTFLISPDGKRSFWSEARDGKFALFVGDSNSGGKQQLALASEYSAYGWMTDKYLLLQKNNSELYITTEDNIKNGAEPLKISDYHRVPVGGYGYGYGGQ